MDDKCNMMGRPPSNPAFHTTLMYQLVSGLTLRSMFLGWWLELLDRALVFDFGDGTEAGFD